LTSLDLSSFNTENVTDMSEMFRGCSVLQTIYAGDGWQLSDMALAVSRNVFNDCTSLVGGQGTAYAAAHVGADYAHIDGGPDNPGYFTATPAMRGDVNGDTLVDINDVTKLIGVVLGNATDYNAAAADCDVAGGSGNIDINDVTTLISYVLNGAWN
jgi:surface protein